jgi:hypothetical protein
VSRGDPALMVYRSAAVRSTDPVYLPVAAFLAELEEIAVVHEEIRDDDDMMLGRGIFTIYAYSTGVVIEPTYRLGRPVHPLFTTEELDKHLSLKGTNV